MTTKTNAVARIVRAAHQTEQPYFMLARATAQDTDLSYEALGVLTYLLSKPNDWEVQVTDLAARCGKQKIYRILKELRERGYIVLDREYVNGKISRWIYQIYETPHLLTEKQEIEKLQIGNQHHTYKRQEQNTEKREKREKSTSLSKVPKRTTKKAAAAPTGVDKKDYEDVPYGERYAIIHAWESYAPGNHIAPYKTPENHATAADLYRTGVTEQNVIDFIQEQIKDTYWQGKTITLQTVKKMIPGWLAHHQAKASKVVGTIAPRFEDTEPADPQEWIR